MTSIEQIIGRTWFDVGSSDAGGTPYVNYMGFRLQTHHLRSNAMTFWDFADDHSSQTIRTLLRCFLRLQHVLLHGKAGEGARAYLEWDSATDIDKPSTVRIGVVYNPGDATVDVVSEAKDALQMLMKTDAQLFQKQRTQKPWSTSDLIIRTDMWAALSNVYTSETVDTDDILECLPTDVFSAEKAGIEGNGVVSSLPNHQRVAISRSDFDVNIFFKKFVPWYTRIFVIENVSEI